ncbi:hypothetical protein F8S09_13585 [Deinococcus sp. SDU3-2]|uniref:Uncharacterized protein n=1 Tax=Deinococcus terrestris TaxID=2651870 RepID=A0A7X1NYE5_9DEIO|nr:hypothetical protein [Deinococcus terrestris]MPY67701.1 hypothetical protein [Deinococcus terrestris]
MTRPLSTLRVRALRPSGVCIATLALTTLSRVGEVVLLDRRREAWQVREVEWVFDDEDELANVNLHLGEVVA